MTTPEAAVEIAQGIGIIAIIWILFGRSHQR